MEFLHTMIRVSDIDESLRFFCDGLGLKQVRRSDYEKGRFSLIFLAAPMDIARAEAEGDGKMVA
ncbi:MAG: lactoylglutathione lyase, partial [Acidimicrobiales bacterium]